jgi:hypothetical protein
MKTRKLSKGIFILALMWSCITNAETYVYSQLMMKDYDEMQSDVKDRVQAAEAVGDSDIDEAKAKLKDALQLTLSRPNNDNMVAKLVPLVRTPLRNIEAFESTLDEVVTQAIGTAKDQKARLTDQATSFIILENILSELKPEVKTNEKMRAIVAKIRDAKIEISKKIKTELKMRAMLKTSESPSDFAAKILPAK